MSIFTQILIILVALGALYASFLHNRQKYEELMQLLPDFRKLLNREQAEHGGQAFGHAAPAQTPLVKLVVYVPDAHAEAVRQAIGQAGGGRIGNYSYCSFSSQGLGRYVPGEGAHPSIGQVGKLEVVEEERIEVTVARENLKNVVAGIKNVHPYEEIVIDIYPLEALPAGPAVHTPEIRHH